MGFNSGFKGLRDFRLPSHCK